MSLISFLLSQVEHIFDAPVVDKLVSTFFLFANLSEIGKSWNTLLHKIADYSKCLLSIAELGNVNVGSDYRCAQTTWIAIVPFYNLIQTSYAVICLKSIQARVMIQSG